MSKWRNIFMLIAVAGMMTVFYGCGEPSTSEKIGQKVEDAGKDIEKGTDKAKEGLADAADEGADALDNLADSLRK